MTGARWADAKGHSTLGSDPAWERLLRWQKSLIDWYGYDKLVRFQTGLGDEFSTSNAFELGKIAMIMDGEWRVAFLANEHPELTYGTAPVPVDASRPRLYGSGYVTGNIVGISKTSSHKDEAWQLVRYLSMDTNAQVKLSNLLRNVPTTTAAARSKAIKPDPKFHTFLQIFANPRTSTTPITASGAAYQDMFGSFLTKWQAGKVKDLHGGLVALDKQIDAQLAQASGGSNVP
jgi:multiple sugar transport system substrate-binding protein